MSEPGLSAFHYDDGRIDVLYMYFMPSQVFGSLNMYICRNRLLDDHRQF